MRAGHHQGGHTPTSCKMYHELCVICIYQWSDPTNPDLPPNLTVRIRGINLSTNGLDFRGFIKIMFRFERIKDFRYKGTHDWWFDSRVLKSMITYLVVKLLMILCMNLFLKIINWAALIYLIQFVIFVTAVFNK